MGNTGWEHEGRPVPSTRLLHLCLARHIHRSDRRDRRGGSPSGGGTDAVGVRAARRGATPVDPPRMGWSGAVSAATHGLIVGARASYIAHVGATDPRIRSVPGPNAAPPP